MDDNTIVVLFGLGMLGLFGILFWKTLQQKTTVTEFVRDEQGRVIQIIEK